MNDSNILLVSAGVCLKKIRGRIYWFIVRQGNEGEWEIPKINVRRGESSVRAAIRMMMEKGGMNARVLEEVGRAGGAALVNGHSVPQRTLFYLMIYKDGGEVIGFTQYAWLECRKASKELAGKRDKQMLREANKLFKKLTREDKIKL
jgi:hypothetical protein